MREIRTTAGISNQRRQGNKITGLLLFVALNLMLACTPAPATLQAPPDIVMSALSATPTATALMPTSTSARTPQSTPTALEVLPTIQNTPEKDVPMKIKIKLGDRELTATLNSGQAARDFYAQLPLNLTLEDYAGAEKIYYLAKRLSIQGEPSGSTPSAGDLAYYAPWGNLAIFYQDGGYANGLVILGKIDDGIEALQVRGSLPTVIEQME